MVFVGVLIFFGAQWITKTGVFKIPGVLTYDESLTDEEKDALGRIFTNEVVLDKDLSIMGEYRFDKPSSADEIIYNIYVPVADYYSTEDNLEISQAENYFADAASSPVDYKMIPLEELDFKKKLLKINGSYYLDDFNRGAIYRVIKFSSEKFDEEVLALIQGKIGMTGLSEKEVLTFAQTGVTALSRGMNQKLQQVGSAEYFAEKIGGFLSKFDITHTSNESSFTEMASANNICSDPRFISTLEGIGLDIVELTGNHNVDCGAAAARNTIDLYNQKGIAIVGGGKNAEEGAKPLEINEKGSGITFLAYNLSTGGATLGEAPGANQYSEEDAVSNINAAKERGDFVIVDVQYYECSAYASEYEDPTCDYANSSAGDQVGFFRHLIEIGADMVVGTSAHQPQTFELYEDGVIYYGLGNLFFDQIWWPGTTRSLVLAHYFHDGKLLQTKVIPTVYDSSMQTDLMDSDTAKRYLERLIKARP